MDRTSTLPGPRMRLHDCRRYDRLKCISRGLRHSLILLSRSAAYTDRANDFSAALQGNATGKDHDSTVIRDMNAEKLPARLRMLGEIFGRNIEGAGGKCFIDRDVDAADPGAIHANMRNKIAPSSTTAIFIGCLISTAFFSAAAIIFRASSSVIVKIPPCDTGQTRCAITISRGAQVETPMAPR
jgi:hypothetical protein